MCTVSMVMDDWNRRHPQFNPPFIIQGPSREEFETFKEEMRREI